ncbi:hypothetical protein RRG08_020559 [Elysia crispata]|uniref:Uncharacterized protein n=1 Tax=Elysia crispata TaxID=231223 RepID=A0AAE1A6H5_9GAST|nr:hypothetical protein RRG08_020559 [Elysia crispata]
MPRSGAENSKLRIIESPGPAASVFSLPTRRSRHVCPAALEISNQAQMVRVFLLLYSCLQLPSTITPASALGRVQLRCQARSLSAK